MNYKIGDRVKFRYEHQVLVGDVVSYNDYSHVYGIKTHYGVFYTVRSDQVIRLDSPYRDLLMKILEVV